MELNKPALDAKDEPSWYERHVGHAITYSRTGVDTVRHELGHALLSDYTEDSGFDLRFRFQLYHTTLTQRQWQTLLGERAAKDWEEMVADAFSAWTDPHSRVTLPAELVDLLREMVK